MDDKFSFFTTKMENQFSGQMLYRLNGILLHVFLISHDELSKPIACRELLFKVRLCPGLIEPRRYIYHHRFKYDKDVEPFPFVL
jgi:hypothetical protein